MIRHWLIRCFFLGLLVLCVGGWLASYVRHLLWTTQPVKVLILPHPRKCGLEAGVDDRTSPPSPRFPARTA